MPKRVITGNPRHDKILDLVNKDGYVSVEALADELDVSAQTIRRDIKKLSDEKLLLRHHGGAGKASSVVNTDYNIRKVSKISEKERIGEAIADEIPDNSTIFITIGTTTEIIAKQLLKRSGLRIITNCLGVANILHSKKDFEVMVCGGKIRDSNGGITGPTALDFVHHFRADYLITSIGSIEPDGTLLDFDFNEVTMVQAMMKASREMFLAADASKFSATAAVGVGQLADVDHFFTDEMPSDELTAMLAVHKVEVTVA